MKIKTYNDSIVDKPKSKIVAVDENFINNNKVILFLKQHLDRNVKCNYDYAVKGIKGTTYFTCRRVGQKKILFDADNKPILNIRNTGDFPFSSHLGFFMGDEENVKIGSVQSDSTLVEINNKSTNEKEILKVLNDKFNCSCGIFQGKESENSPMICKVLEIMDSNSFITYSDKEYSVEIASDVDISIIIALAICFAEMNLATRKDRVRVSDPYSDPYNSDPYNNY